MKLTISAGALKDALSIVAPAINAKHPVLALTCVRIADGRVTGNNNEIQITAPLGVEFTGALVVDFARLMSLVKGIPATQEITIEDGDRSAMLKFGRSRYQLAKVAVADFPVMSPPTGDSFDPPDGFLAAIAFADAHAGQHKSMPILEGVRVAGHRVTGTIGTKLGFVDLDHDMPVNIVLPPDTVSAIRQIGKPDLIVTGETMIEVRFGEISILSRLMDGQYPDVDRVVPTDLDSRDSVTIDADHLVSILSRIAAGGGDNSATLVSDGSVMVIGAPSSDRSGICCEHVLDGNLPQFSITLDCQLIQGVLDAHKGATKFTLYIPPEKNPAFVLTSDIGARSIAMLRNPPYAGFDDAVLSAFAGEASEKEAA